MATLNDLLLRSMIGLREARIRLGEERGQDLLEYALLGGLIAAAITAAAVVAAMTGAIEAMADGIADCIDFDSVTACP